MSNETNTTEQAARAARDDVQGFALPLLIYAAAGAGVGALIGIGFCDAIADALEPIDWQHIGAQLRG